MLVLRPEILVHSWIFFLSISKNSKRPFFLMFKKVANSEKFQIAQDNYILLNRIWGSKVLKYLTLLHTCTYRQSSTYMVFYQHGFLNNTVYFGTLICPLSTKLLLRLHSLLLTRLFFQSLKKQRKQRTACI